MWTSLSQSKLYRAVPSLTVGVQPEILQPDCKLRLNPDCKGGDMLTTSLPLVSFHETAPTVNEIFSYCPFDPGFHTHSDEPGCCWGSMQVEFRVKVRRCHLSHELQGSSLLTQSPEKYGLSPHHPANEIFTPS